MWKDIKYSNEYFESMLEMTQSHYGSENVISQEDYIQHEYFENPTGDAVISLALDSEKKRLAGQYIVNPMRFWVKGNEYKCVCSLNTLTREEYRGQGIFTGLAKHVYDDATKAGYEFCYGMPNQNSYPGFMKKLGFSDIGSIPLLLRPLSPSDMIVEKTKSRALSVFGKPFNGLYNCKKNVSKNKNAQIKIVQLKNNNLNYIDDFWNAIKNKYSVMMLRDSKYIKYRFLDIKHRQYYPYFAIKDGKPVAFSIGRIIPDVAGMTCGMLVDFLFADGEDEAGQVLLDYMLGFLQSKGACLVGGLMLAHTQESKLLKKNKFFTCPKKLEPQPFPLIFRAFDESIKKTGIEDLDNWFFVMGDYDVI